MKTTSHGFTLVELMVAMVIFMIVCAIAIPNYLSAEQRAHEAVAVSYLRQVQTGEEAYRLNNHEYAGTFAKLQPYISADLIRPALPVPGFGNFFASTAYAEPIPAGAPQGNSGSNPGNSGSAPGQGGSSPGNSGSAPGHGGSNPGNSGSAPGQTGSGGGSTGGTGSGSGSTGTGSVVPDT
jgi:prepilin-type N-terminal cleavage/methylation domain-containing protein